MDRDLPIGFHVRARVSRTIASATPMISSPPGLDSRPIHRNRGASGPQPPASSLQPPCPILTDMWRIAVVLLAVTMNIPDQPKSVKADLVFLTRDGCVNTPDMVNNLDDALKALGWRNDYQYIDIGKLPRTDARTGYPTPTVLWKGKDIFGMPVPA